MRREEKRREETIEVIIPGGALHVMLEISSDRPPTAAATSPEVSMLSIRLLLLLIMLISFSIRSRASVYRSGGIRGEKML